MNDPTSVLAVVGEDMAGAARFVPAGKKPHGFRHSIALSDAEVGAFLADLRAHRGAMPNTTYAPRISLAGQQPKLGLYRDADGWRMPYGDMPSTHILKPAPENLTDIDINEAAMMHAAAAVGIKTSASAVENIGGQRVFVTTRYDRVRDQGGDILRIHQEDFAQALEYRAQAKYQKEKGPALRNIIPFLRDNVANPVGEVDQFNRLLAFNVAIGNADAHAKNHSILITPLGNRLAPAYDLLSVAAYPAYSQELALSVGKQYHAHRVQGRDWRHYAEKSGQDAERVLAIVAEVWSRVPDAVADSLARYGASRAMKKAIMDTVRTVEDRMP
ncbi:MULTISPECIES: HipA domain-containing protein [unclassified Corynebacterium]|uniref:HipA domain-containing protein n=1 Tax=unclassified Corynebacterium TaxID=2624378 RepID=UPI001D0EF7D8|nr:MULTISPECIES: HipA domain-containing protein [unclassified Corynebacterium]